MYKRQISIITSGSDFDAKVDEYADFTVKADLRSQILHFGTAGEDVPSESKGILEALKIFVEGHIVGDDSIG